MARYRVIDTHPRLLPVTLATQFPSGTFEYAVDHLLDHLPDHATDRSRFDLRFGNDTTGAPASLPSVLR